MGAFDARDKFERSAGTHLKSGDTVVSQLRISFFLKPPIYYKDKCKHSNIGVITGIKLSLSTQKERST